MPASAKKRKYRLAEKTDLPRHTYYVDAETAQRIKVYAAIDGRGVSEVVREALDRWLDARERRLKKGSGRRIVKM